MGNKIKKYTAFNESKTLKEWSLDIRCKVTYAALVKRVSCYKWTLEKGLITGKLKKIGYLAFGEVKNLKEWAADTRCVVDFGTLRGRISNYNWDIETAMTLPLVYKNPKFYIGKTFNFVYIEDVVEKDSKGCAIVLCRCLYKNCGNTFKVKLNTAKNKQSCGCAKEESFLKSITKHGQSKSPYYTTWYNLNSRCYDQNSKNYKDYGGRGIYVCDEWRTGQKDEKGLLNFIDWCKENPRPKNFSLDRIDNDGPYSPKNCRWANKSTQSQNQRNVKYFEQKLNEKDKIIEKLQKEIEILKNEKY